jgi:hypothetical protein
MDYFGILIAFLGGFWFLINFLMPGKTLRHWRQKAKTLFGICGMSWAVLTLYELIHMEIRYTKCGAAVSWAKGLLAGMSIATVILLYLTGSRRKKEIT